MDAPRGTPDAILRPTVAEQAITVERVAPDARLAGLVDYHWYVGWRTDAPHRQQVVPHPRVHLAVEEWKGEPRLLVHGVTREPFFRTLEGEGHTIGVAFRPGGFRPFLGRAVGTLTGTVRPAGDVLGRDDRGAAAEVLGTAEVGVMVAAVESYLLALDPGPDPLVEQVHDLVAQAECDRTVTRAEDLAERASTSLRSLQRLFTEYVGIGPKWVVSRFRILDAAAAAHGGADVDWAALAVDLGFTDQAHLTRVFTSVVGTPPATYRREA